MHHQKTVNKKKVLAINYHKRCKQKVKNIQQQGEANCMQEL